MSDTSSATSKRDEDRCQDEMDISPEQVNEKTKYHPQNGSRISRSHLGSRILVTWLELTLVGITGGILGATIGGPPGFIIYLATSLLTVAVLFYNINKLFKSLLDSSNVNRNL